MGGNMFDKFFSGDLAALKTANNSLYGKVTREIAKVDEPFIKGEDLDWNDEKQVEDLYEYGADPFRGRA